MSPLSLNCDFVCDKTIPAFNRFLSSSHNSFSSVIVCGYCHIGDNNSFWIKSTVVYSVNVGSNCVIQAGMVVDKDVPDGTTVFYKYKERIMAIPKIIEE